MFAGIVERVCRAVAVRQSGSAGHVSGPRPQSAIRLEIDLGDLLDGLQLGASLAINGVCLTLAKRRGSVGGFDVVPETWRLTNLRSLQSGHYVNTERALRVGDRIDGHFVQGHVDGVGRIDKIQREGGESKLWVATDSELMAYIVRKGSIALDGISLTVAEVDANRFSVALIPTTLERTVLGRRQPGDLINIETDILARLVVSRLDALLAGKAPGAAGQVTWERLQESGFLP